MGGVAIVGGGVSGIRAALTLARAGRRVTLFEKNQYLGGRVFSFVTRDFGEIDIGQHIWMRACTVCEELITALDVLQKWIFRQERLSMTFRRPDGSSFAFNPGWLPGTLSLLPPLLRVPGISLADKLRFLWLSARVCHYD